MDFPTPGEKLTDLMAREGKLRKYRKKTVIQNTDLQMSFNYLKSGFVKRYLINSDGSISTDLIYGPGDVFSLTIVYKTLLNQSILQSREVYYYETLTNAEVYSVSTSVLEDEFTKDPLLYKELLTQAGKRMTSATQALENQSMKNAYKKLAHKLAYYGRRFGKQTDKGVEIRIPLTHQDLADLMSLTRETVSNSMGELRKKKLIKTGRCVTILDIEKLENEAFE